MLILTFEGMNTIEALAYIKDVKGIAVLPTLGDNSPYALMEVVAENIPMITTLAGGGYELIKVWKYARPFYLHSVAVFS